MQPRTPTVWPLNRSKQCDFGNGKRSGSCPDKQQPSWELSWSLTGDVKTSPIPRECQCSYWRSWNHCQGTLPVKPTNMNQQQSSIINQHQPASTSIPNINHQHQPTSTSIPMLVIRLRHPMMMTTRQASQARRELPDRSGPRLGSVVAPRSQFLTAVQPAEDNQQLWLVIILL